MQAREDHEAPRLAVDALSQEVATILADRQRLQARGAALTALTANAERLADAQRRLSLRLQRSQHSI